MSFLRTREIKKSKVFRNEKIKEMQIDTAYSNFYEEGKAEAITETAKANLVILKQQWEALKR